MKHLRLARFLPWLVIAISPPLLGHCGGTVEHGTETGNPPVVEQQKLHVVLHEDGVGVNGDPGAVSPGATVSVTNLRSGEHSEATAGADGSVSVSVPGTLDDEYQVTVSSGGRSQTVQVSANSPASGAAGAGGASGNALASASCDSLEQTLNDQVAAGYADASKACQADSDCTTGNDVGCYYTCGGGPVVSVAGMQAAQRALLESTAPVCAELTERCGPRGPPGCPAIAFSSLTCNNGTCEQLSCQGLENRIGQQVSDIINNTPRDCTQDADCKLVLTNVSCIASCGDNYESVPVTRATQLSDSIQNADARVCGESAARSCPGPRTLPCAPRPSGTYSSRAACIAGECDIESVPL